MSYPSELDTDDISELASYIERRYPTEELRMCDTRTIHFAYWDKSHRSVSSEFLDHIQQAGYRILYAGVVPETWDPTGLGRMSQTRTRRKRQCR